MTQATEIGGYQVLAELKSGGMGAVFVARRRGAHGFAKLVALKVIRRDRVDTEGVREMFLDEAKLVARLDHPAIAQVHDFGDDDGTLYLAMEYVAGLSFDEIGARAAGPMPPGVAVRALVEVCRGLHAAHEAVDLDDAPLGVVHRDVSPQNLMLTFDGRIKILDFGIARAVDRVSPETQTGMLKGKPAYMSPEQMAAGKIDRRADLFSAGVVLYELLTGEPLFTAENIFALADKVRSAPIPPPSQKAGALPAGLDAAVLRCLSRDPDGRYPSAAVMADALEAIAEAAGAESLASYAARALVEPRENQRRFIHALSQPEPVAVALAPAGRPLDVATLGASSELASAVAGDRRAPHEATGPRRRRWGRWTALFLVVVGLGAAAGWLRGWWSPVARVETARVDPARPRPEAAPPSPPAVEPAVPPAPAVPPPALTEKPPSAKRKRPTRKQPAKTTAAATEPSSSPTEFGHLKVTATPYANVRIDGKLVGPTPLMRHRLPAGTHRVELIDPETGALRTTQTVTVEVGGLTNLALP